VIPLVGEEHIAFGWAVEQVYPTVVVDIGRREDQRLR
jgi:hypothetical protein